MIFLTDTNWEEHYIKKGDPTKPTYYIIRRRWETTGLLGRYNIFAGHIRYALSKGWLPVIDMQNYPNPHLPPDKLGKENSWEYFFEQPLRIGLKQAYSGENVILSNGEEILPRPYETMSFYENQNGILTEWRMLIKMGLLKIKPELYEEMLTMGKKLFPSNERVLGVLLRGTDYAIRRLPNHPIIPPIEFAISTVVAKLKEWNCKKVYLATEDKGIIKNFKKVFGDACLIFDREYIDYKLNKPISLCRIDRQNDYFLQGKEYLTQIIILSMCNSLVAARCGGSVAAMLLTENFEHTYFFNLGRYGVISLD